MNKLSEEILAASFLNTLEKNAVFEKFIKVFKEADRVAGSKGIREGLKILEGHKSPLSALPIGALKKPVSVKTYGPGVGKLQEIALNETGNTASALLAISEGVGKDKNLLQNVGKVGKNFVNLLKDQVRGSKYKVLPASSVIKTGPGGRQIKGQGLFKNFKIFNRKIEGTTTSGDYIVKKRKAMRPLAIAATPVGFGTYALISGSGKKDETPVSRVGEAIKETGMWAIAPPIATAKVISDMLK
jgi:hypothetical protein